MKSIPQSVTAPAAEPTVRGNGRWHDHLNAYMHYIDMSESWEEIVDAVEAARMRKGMTQSYLASRVGLSQSQYSRVARHMFVPREPIRQEFGSWLASHGECGDAPRREVLKLMRKVDALRNEVSETLGHARRPLRSAPK